MYAECSHWANWRRAFHTNISLLCSGFLDLYYLSLFAVMSQDVLTCNFIAVYWTDHYQLHLQQSTCRKWCLTGCHEVGKVFMVRLGMSTWVSTMRQNTGTDFKESPLHTTIRGYHLPPLDTFSGQPSSSMYVWVWEKWNGKPSTSLCPADPGAKQIAIECSMHAPCWKGH